MGGIILRTPENRPDATDPKPAGDPHHQRIPHAGPLVHFLELAQLNRLGGVEEGRFAGTVAAGCVGGAPGEQIGGFGGGSGGGG